MNQPPKILIVGAGAAGMVTGYLLTLSGAVVTFYVRPERMAQVAGRPQNLYCYDDHQLKVFDGFDTVCSAEEVASHQFDYVLTTLDGAAMRSEEGKKLLHDLGRAVMESDAVVVCLGVMQGVEAFFAEQTGVPEERLLFGAFTFFSHNVPLPEQPKSSDIDWETLAQCVFGYVHVFGNSGLALTRTNRNIGRVFAEAFNRSGVSSCSVAPNLRIADLMGSFAFPPMVAGVIEGWPEHRKLYQTETWKLTSRATKEVVMLPRFGPLAKVVGVLWEPLNLLTRTWKYLDQASQPLDFRAFNKFHHGGKVKDQDVEVVRDILLREEALGREMPNLRELVERVDSRCG